MLACIAFLYRRDLLPPRSPAMAKLLDAVHEKLKTCARKGDVTLAEELLQAMEGEEQEISKETYHCIIHACVQADDLGRAESYFSRMIACDLQPDTLTFNLVLNACAKMGDIERAEGMFAYMLRCGMLPNMVTYSTMCKCYSRQGQVAKIEAVIRRVEQEGNQPNEYFYASLISACGACTPPDVSGAEKAFKSMIARGLRGQSVKRILKQVIGEQRALRLFSTLGVESRQQRSVGPAVPRVPQSHHGQNRHIHTANGHGHSYGHDHDPGSRASNGEKSNSRYEGYFASSSRHGSSSSSAPSKNHWKAAASSQRPLPPPPRFGRGGGRGTGDGCSGRGGKGGRKGRQPAEQPLPEGPGSDVQTGAGRFATQSRAPLVAPAHEQDRLHAYHEPTREDGPPPPYPRRPALGQDASSRRVQASTDGGISSEAQLSVAKGLDMSPCKIILRF
mmetsp:Transcript_125177/g.325260  ORF Transcript_125177/g.325260 Transcript_125177/m.325260 type:complete len:447 (+) Transcript_125177:2-1342(+)